MSLLTFENKEGTLTLMVDGNVLSTNIKALREESLQLINGEDPSVGPWDTLVVDVTQAKMIDSTGLNFLVFLCRFVKKKQARMGILVGNASVQKSLTFVRLDRQANITLVN